MITAQLYFTFFSAFTYQVRLLISNLNLTKMLCIAELLWYTHLNLMQAMPKRSNEGNCAFNNVLSRKRCDM